MGKPMESDLAGVCNQIWGKALSNETNKDDMKKILVPSNCGRMKTPRLNTEVYVKLNEPAQMKDKAAQRKQKFAVKAAIPVMQAMVKLFFLKFLKTANYYHKVCVFSSSFQNVLNESSIMYDA